MAPITCRVVDHEDVGVRAMHVVLSCYDQFLNTIAKFESCTDPDGVIDSWLPPPSAGNQNAIQTTKVDALEFPRVSLTFYPTPYIPAALGSWVSMQTNLSLLGANAHAVILKLGHDASRVLHYGGIELVC